MTTPILILGDAPNLPSGLARIARDLAGHLHAASGILDIEVAQLGLEYDGQPFPWRVYPVLDQDNWGEADLPRVWAWHAGNRPGILLTVWDPARCAGTAGVEINGVRWGYFAVDGANPNNRIGGPAGAALKAYQRVLAYTDYGARVLKNTLEVDSIAWLPHGINMSTFRPTGSGVCAESRREAIGRWGQSKAELTLGCVATNQPRKDLALAFDLARRLKARLWLATDKLNTMAWSIPELASVFDRNDDRLLITMDDLTDQELAHLYTRCDLTIAPGYGEGFGYPIVESLACGTPVVHVNYAGGAEITPAIFRFDPAGTDRREGAYVIERPGLFPLYAKVVADRIMAWREKDPATVAAYCKGSVAHLDWRYLWGRWRSWVAKGLQEFRDGIEGNEADQGG